MNYHHVRICLYETKGIIGSAIRWQTRSRWSHASLLLPDNSVIEAREGVGVRHVKHPSLKGATIFRIKGMTDEQSDQIIDEARKLIGAKYDWLAILRFVSRKRMTSNDHWFCSELVHHCCREAEVYLLHRSVESWQVSPAILGYSPLLEKDHD